EALAACEIGARDMPLTMTLNDYDPIATSYYIHAKRSESVPIAAYLGYYQSVEYFFRRYALRSAIALLQRCMKNPTFTVWNDGQAANLISALSDEIKETQRELPQLKSVLTFCVSPDGLLEFLESDGSLRDHLRRKDRLPGIAPIGNGLQGQELVDRIAERIYQLRCQIVHSKGENQKGESILLLPDSNAANYVREDLKVMRYIARTVVWASADRIDLR
ncbi:hypothetical protein, partial [Nocardia sp. NPDC004722]